ncbi:MAG: hypothetical protein HWE20_13450 [Gammaproteobacteria bacterium]|nr:hypothetical protein [Gammaproteobacteria bacterium]
MTESAEFEHALASYDQAADVAIEAGNALLEADLEANPLAVSDGLLAGAIQFWLYSRQPCDTPDCEDCADISTAEQRLSLLHELVDEMAKTSEYFHNETDANAGHA